MDESGRLLLRWLTEKGRGYCASQDEIAGVLAAQDIVQTLAQLKQRSLVEDVGNGVRFQVEAIRRWFATE